MHGVRGGGGGGGRLSCPAAHTERYRPFQPLLFSLRFGPVSLCRNDVASGHRICRPMRRIRTGCPLFNTKSAVPPPRVYKNNTQDCGLLGNCDGGQCKCYYGYAGESCAMLDLVPAPPRAGLRQQGNRSNWCGTILQDETDSDL